MYWKGLRDIAKYEIYNSVTETSRDDFLKNTAYIQLINMAGGAAPLASLPAAAVTSALVTKSIYDGHRYHQGDKNFRKKRSHFFNCVYFGIGGELIPRIINNVREIYNNAGGTLMETMPEIWSNASQLLVGDGVWTPRAIAALVAFQTYHHVKHISNKYKERYAPPPPSEPRY